MVEETDICAILSKHDRKIHDLEDYFKRLKARIDYIEKKKNDDK